MVWIIIIVGIFLVLAMAGAGAEAKEAQEKAELANRTAERTRAYGDYLRRTAADPRIAQMTTNELHEYIATNVRAYNKAVTDTKNGAGLFGAIVIGGAIFLGISAQEWGAFLVPAILGMVIISWLEKRELAKIAAGFAARGLDPARLSLSDA